MASGHASESSDLKFADLSILHDAENPLNTVELVQEAVNLGYDTVAINIDIGELTEALLMADGQPKKPVPGQKKKLKNTKMKPIPPAFTVPEKDLNLSELRLKGKKFRQYTRLTATVTDPDFIHALVKPEIVDRYDILAVRPETEQIFQACCSKNAIDLFSIDSSVKYPFLMKKKLMNQALERGFGFELSYAPALKDSLVRRDFFGQGRLLISSTQGGKGVVMSSGASDRIQLRGPYDVANMFTLFGESTDLGRKAISAHAKRVLLRAETKKTVKGAIHVLPLTPGDLSSSGSGSGKLPKQLQQLSKIPEFNVQIERIPTAAASNTKNNKSSKANNSKKRKNDTSADAAAEMKAATAVKASSVVDNCDVVGNDEKKLKMEK